VPFMRTGNLVFTAGQLPLRDGKLQVTGLLGRDVDTAAGKEAAKLCAINILAQAKAAIGDLDKIKRLVKITVFVASAPDFTEQHLVANGASDFLVEVLGEPGKHARAAVGTASLPLNAAVEIEAVIEVA
jgi:enamine deaminase RidA (YjgF/YER057c/UK114 family)